MDEHVGHVRVGQVGTVGQVEEFITGGHVGGGGHVTLGHSRQSGQLTGGGQVVLHGSQIGQVTVGGQVGGDGGSGHVTVGGQVGEGEHVGHKVQSRGGQG